MSRRTIAIDAVLYVLALGSPLITANANPLTRQYFDQGLEKYDAGNYQGAIVDYNKAIEIDPNNENAYVNRGISKMNLYDYSGAISDFSKAMAIDPKHPDAYVNRGIAKGIFQNSYPDAVSDLSEAIEIDPKHAQHITIEER